MQRKSNGKGDALVEASHDVEAGEPGTPRATGEVAAPQLTRAELVEEFFRTLYPDDFQLALPVKKHKVNLQLPELLE